MILNPSYFAPYSFRLFAQIDPERDWESLIDSGYTMLDQVSNLSTTGLPPDWIAYDPTADTYRPMPRMHSLQSRYSFDAIRVWWRLALDAAWFNAPRAEAYLKTHLPVLIEIWEQEGRLPARLSLEGGSPFHLRSYQPLRHALPRPFADSAGNRRRNISAKAPARLPRRLLGQRHRLLHPKPGLVRPPAPGSVAGTVENSGGTMRTLTINTQNPP